MGPHLLSDRISMEPAGLCRLQVSHPDPVRRIHGRLRNLGADRVLQCGRLHGAVPARATEAPGVEPGFADGAADGPVRIRGLPAASARKRNAVGIDSGGDGAGQHPESFTIYRELSLVAAKRGVDLIVWPEAAAAFPFQPDANYPESLSDYAEYRTALLKLAGETGEPILFGAPAIAERDGHYGSFNRADLVSPRGEVVAYYDKINLVPFGEYVPARKLLGYFVNRVVEGFGDLFPGTEQTLFPVKGARLGVLICYESVFPDLTRRAVDKGAEVLVNITNDAWYGESSAPFQALAMAAMRSAETKAPMIRTANTGISAIIKPSGEITARTPLFKRGTEIEDVAWRPVRTLYTIVGDLFSEICFALTAAGLLVGWIRPRKPNQLEAVVEQILASNGARKRKAS